MHRVQYAPTEGGLTIINVNGVPFSGFGSSVRMLVETPISVGVSNYYEVACDKTSGIWAIIRTPIDGSNIFRIDENDILHPVPGRYMVIETDHCTLHHSVFSDHKALPWYGRSIRNIYFN